MSDVAIVGIGMHAFGRHPISGREQGAIAARRALADAGIAWSDVEYAFGGSSAAGAADTLCRDLGLTGVPFINVANGCATGGSALISAYNALRSGAADVVMAIGFDKHPRGRVRPAAGRLRHRRLVRRDRPDADDAVLRHEDPALHARARHLQDALAKVAAKAFRNGAKNPNAWRRTPMSEDQILDATMIADPLTQYMFCSPAEGAVALVLTTAERAAAFTDDAGVPALGRAALAAVRVVRGVQPGAGRRARRLAVASPPPPGRSRWPASARARSTSSRSRTPSPAPRSCTSPSAGSAPTASRRTSIRSGATEIGGALPVNTDGGCLANGEPIGASGLRQVHESVVQLRGDAGERQVPGDPRTAFTHVYGAPGISACTVLTR